MKFVVNLNKIAINNKQILNNIKFTAQTGDVILLKGRNGIGKTTFLKSLMNNFQTKKDGTVSLNNNKITNLTTDEITKNGVFYFEQNPIEIPGITCLTLLKEINKNFKNYPLNEFIEKIDLLLKEFSLEKEILTKDINVNLSGGQKKKFLFIQAILADANIFLIDEIETGLDIQTFKKITNCLNKLKKDKIIIFISHNQKFIDSLKPTKIINF